MGNQYGIKKECENKFKKDFFTLMNNSVFGKTIKNAIKYKGIKLVSTDRRRNYLVSEPNFHSTKFFMENLLAIEMKESHISTNKPVYLGLAILDISKTKMYDFWYNHIKPRYGEKAKLCYTDTDSFITHIITEDLYKDISEDVEKRFDTSNYEIGHCL